MEQNDDGESGDRLEGWFREAQQSLGLAGPICTEANALVSTSRRQIEQATVLWAQVTFLREAINEQLEMMRTVQLSLEESQERGNEELEKSIEDLRGMEESLEASLKNLQRTEVDKAFGHETGKSLRSFVFEDGIGKLKKTVATVVENSKSTQLDVSKDIKGLGQDIKALSENMVSMQDLKGEDLETARKGADVIATNAHAMATLLESLARHYDQCLTAVEMKKSPESAEGLDELLKVLENDSQQVEDVVNELYERRKAIETSERSVSDVYENMQQKHGEIVQFFDKLSEFTKVELPKHLATLEAYSQKQKGHVEEIFRLVRELSSLVEYYDMFFNSYHALVLEIGRRSRAERKLESIVNDMSNTLSRLHQEELDARKAFIDDRGDYLPSDLWTGLTEYPPQPKIEFSKATKLPPVSEDSVQKARNEVKL
ncbi:hypothetical protein TRICI_001201 [Trichomonascus ciferrii]|uniref:Autophagy-related protein 17 n=1 Tax=Trichomonascus ciferrii TaxID=44093 RepID=A0A642VCI5_9ASCO|nr:hypothetical protein TRICI_001201 [Trichomonascus ciferrii]